MLLRAVAMVYYYSCASLRVPQLQPTERALRAQPVLAQPVLAQHARVRRARVAPISMGDPQSNRASPLFYSTSPYWKNFG